jgi:UDP-2-acetamido-2,6-beta-L-arabino-hexul-4-ose reductase
MKIAITGPDGFIAWHTRAALHTKTDHESLRLGREEFDNPETLDAVLNQADAVIHLAGVNRTGDEKSIAEVNRWLATQLVAGLRRTNRTIPVVYGNSIHKVMDTVFGRAKTAAADTLKEWADESGAAFADVVLPNVFGEHCRPFYNSVVATFCHQLVNDETPEIQVDREMSLLHVQRAAQILIDAAEDATSGTIEPDGTLITVTGLLERLAHIRAAYVTADLPDLSDPFTRDLFNTYRSYTFPAQWPIYPEVRGDQRGELFEVVKSSGGEAQVFFSTTRPGFTRGQHFHLHKVERFLVLRGSGVIRLRKLFTDEVVEFPVSGDRPAIIDMPTMWVHSIVNTGDEELLTLFFADELFDPENPDTYPEEV